MSAQPKSLSEAWATLSTNEKIAISGVVGVSVTSGVAGLLVAGLVGGLAIAGFVFLLTALPMAGIAAIRERWQGRGGE